MLREPLSTRNAVRAWRRLHFPARTAAPQSALPGARTQFPRVQRAAVACRANRLRRERTPFPGVLSARAALLVEARLGAAVAAAGWPIASDPASRSGSGLLLGSVGRLTSRDSAPALQHDTPPTSDGRRGPRGLHFPKCLAAPRAGRGRRRRRGRAGGLHLPACPAAGAGPEPEPEPERRGLGKAGARGRRRQQRRRRGQPEPRALGLRSAP